MDGRQRISDDEFMAEVLEDGWFLWGRVHEDPVTIIDTLVPVVKTFLQHPSHTFIVYILSSLQQVFELSHYQVQKQNYFRRITISLVHSKTYPRKSFACASGLSSSAGLAVKFQYTRSTDKLAVTVQTPSQAWGRWPEQPHQAIDSYYTVDISGIIQTCDSRTSATSTSNGSSRALMPPHYVPLPAYTAAPITTILSHHHHIPPLPPPLPQQQQPQQQQQTSQQHLHLQNPFAFSHYQTTSTTNNNNNNNNNNVVSQFTNSYLQSRPALSYSISPDSSLVRGMPFCRPQRQGFIIETQQNQNQNTKNESTWNPSPELSLTTPVSMRSSSSPVAKKTVSETTFGTEVDTLMKAIQSKPSNQSQAAIHVPKGPSVVGLVPPSYQTTEIWNYETFRQSRLTQNGMQDEVGKSKSRKRYQCTIEGCTKSFFQKTHLDIHERAHTGVKPYSCKQPGCNRTFSQLGNLKTHERRHTGERPYQCEICGKRFAQRGNVRAHRIVHDQAKPYVCILDDCGKQFTQLGNLKSHQNKFHITTLRTLTERWASVQDGDSVPAADKELWEYFAKLYKNSNKGIKGRGKDRKVGSSHMMTAMRGVGVNRAEGFGICGPGRPNMVVNLNLNVATHPLTRASGNSSYNSNTNYDEEASNSGSGTSGDGSVGTCYDEAPSDSFEDQNRSSQNPYGERMYQGSIGGC
ncbi:putative zinc finger protein ozf [Erysiphe neolycopersici]|uniref:Putative zinc finger protein ozf n=1 Tax=Erysiphe neolycopersici TaxID=212602 RepID=A0A420HIY4_9PEZI|nr:putative zinc finger protein ozf [Erysiphe neolycopersici]